jgi:hypothetical protein
MAIYLSLRFAEQQTERELITFPGFKNFIVLVIGLYGDFIHLEI